MAQKYMQTIHPNCRQEKNIWQRLKLPVFALDEAGRGALAGPVCACAFTVKKPFKIKPLANVKIRDSKQLSQRLRQAAAEFIKNNVNFAHAVALVPAKIIDKVNIRQANFMAMRQALKKLSRKTGYKKYFVFVDGNDPIPGLDCRQKCFIKGDTKVFSLASASIMAKTTRDKYMERLAKQAPRYGFAAHKGYGTKLHYQKIKKHGVSAHHRKSFLS